MFFFTGKLRAWSFLFWITKDILWCSLFYPALIWIFAILALASEVLVSIRGEGFRAPMQFMQWCSVFWLFGNGIWVFGDTTYGNQPLCYARVGWALTPAISPDDRYHEDLARFAQWTMVGALAAGVLPYLFLVPDIRTAVRAREGFVSDEKRGLMTPRADAVRQTRLVEGYGSSFLLFWIAKDIFWAWGSLSGGVLCAFLTLGVIIHTTWLMDESMLDTSEGVGLACWIAGNTLWMASELGFNDEFLWMRIVAVLSMTVCLPCVGVHWFNVDEVDLKEVGP